MRPGLENPIKLVLDMGVSNTIVYKEAWAVKLQEQLDEPTKWKDICRVDYTNSKVLHNPYLTDATIASHSRGTAYTFNTITQTDENVSIDTSYIMAQFIDRADLAQSDYAVQMEIAARQGVIINEQLETAVLGAYGSMTEFGAGDLAGTSSADSTQITVSTTNIDDIIRAIKRVINVAAGQTLLERNGAFIVWRPVDFEMLEAYTMANGFATADTALKNGGQQGMNYMGVTHYSSNLLTANHVVAGVKKVLHLGICKGTYGQVMVNEKDPDNYSGISIVSRVDYKVKVWTKVLPVLFDVNVS